MSPALQRRRPECRSGGRDAGSEPRRALRSEEHRLNSSHPSISYAVFCLKKKITALPRLYSRTEQTTRYFWNRSESFGKRYKFFSCYEPCRTGYWLHRLFFFFF